MGITLGTLTFGKCHWNCITGVCRHTNLVPWCHRTTPSSNVTSLAQHIFFFTQLKFLLLYKLASITSLLMVMEKKCVANDCRVKSHLFLSATITRKPTVPNGKSSSFTDKSRLVALLPVCACLDSAGKCPQTANIWIGWSFVYVWRYWKAWFSCFRMFA